jgi:hypothetical protein
MNNRIYSEVAFTRELNSFKVKILELHCPKCFSSDIYADLKDIYVCKECSDKNDFKDLLTTEQVRDRKIKNILS